MIIVIIIIHIFLKLSIDEVQGIDGLQHFVVLARLRLGYVCFRSIEQDTLLEGISPGHLHLHDKLTLLVVSATHIHDAVFLNLCAAGNLFGRPVFNAFHPLIVLQGQQGVEQTDDEVLVLAEYFLESEVGFRV